MFARSAKARLLTRAVTGFGALFLVGVLLAAMPNHRSPIAANDLTEAALQAQAAADHASMPGMDMEQNKSSEKQAMVDMENMHHGSNAHMHMTAARQANDADKGRAEEIVNELRAGIEKYRDYRVALSEGYQIFLPNVPQREYHFTNYKNGFLEALAFDASRPTSLLYKKTAGGYELVGAMYTMPRSANEEQLNGRVPLSVAQWHLHTNLCMPPRDKMRGADWRKFGLRGSISTQAACDAAGGTFHPVVFGWMVHVYPYENSQDKIFAMHHLD